jgi:hypothetical protein
MAIRGGGRDCHGHSLAEKVRYLMVIDFLVQFRWLWIAGRPGGGKTSLSIYLADLLIKGNYANKIAINTPLIGYEPMLVVESPRDVVGFENCVIILDEAWLYIGQGASRKDVNPWLGFIRKGNNYLIAPSVLPLTKDFNVFRVSRRFNWMQLGAPVWQYQWNLDSPTDKDKGRWFWWNPAQVFGLYDHKAKPDECYYIYDFSVTGAQDVRNNQQHERQPA